MKKISMLAAALFFVSASANADVDVKTYQKSIATGGSAKQMLETYATGVARGILWANAAVTQDKAATPIFCMPPKLGLDQSMVLSVTDRYIKEKMKEGTVNNDTPFEFVVLMALRETFPCL